MPWMLCLCETMVKAILLLLLLILLYAARPNDTFRRKEINFLHEHDIHFICPSFILATGINKKKKKKKRHTRIYTQERFFSFVSFHSFVPRRPFSFFLFFFFVYPRVSMNILLNASGAHLCIVFYFFLYIHTPVNRISIWDCRYRKLTYN